MSGQAKSLSLQQRIFHVETKQQIQKVSTPQEIANRRIYNLKIAQDEFKKQNQEQQNQLNKQKMNSKQIRIQMVHQDNNKQKLISQIPIKPKIEINTQMVIQQPNIIQKNQISKESLLDKKNNEKKQQNFQNTSIQNNNAPNTIFPEKKDAETLNSNNNKPQLNIFPKASNLGKSTFFHQKEQLTKGNKTPEPVELSVEPKNIFNIQKQENNNQPPLNNQKPIILSFLNKPKQQSQKLAKQKEQKQQVVVNPNLPIKAVQKQQQLKNQPIIQKIQNKPEQKVQSYTFSNNIFKNITSKQVVSQKPHSITTPVLLFSPSKKNQNLEKQQKTNLNISKQQTTNVNLAKQEKPNLIQQKPIIDQNNNIFKDTKLPIKSFDKVPQSPQNQKNSIYNPSILFNINTTSIPVNFLSKPTTAGANSVVQQPQDKNKSDLFAPKQNNLFTATNNQNLFAKNNLFLNSNTTTNNPNLFSSNTNATTGPNLFGNPSNKTLFGANNQSSNPFNNNNTNPFSASNPNPFGSYSNASNPFGSSSNQSFLNKPKQEENEGSQEGDQQQKSPPSPQINPLNSTGNYQYQKSSEILFKGQANHFRRNNNSDVIRNIYITIQKFENKYNLIIRSVQTKTIRYQGLIRKNTTFQYMNANKANIKADKLISIDESTKKPVQDMLRIQFKDENISVQILKKVGELKFD